jgi:Ca2+-binding RTX toxin-like protein
MRGRGGDGDDVIDGGRGDDVLRGGAGADRFAFEDAATMGRDVIEDFGRGDRIDLRRVDADATRAGDQGFDFIGSKWLSEAGDLGFYKDTNGWTSVQGDTDGDGAYDFAIRLEGLHDLTAGDFLL